MILEFAVHHGDAIDFQSDLLLLKYAQARWGIDSAIAAKLFKREIITEQELCPPVGQSVLVHSKSAIAAPLAMFVGTPSLESLSYNHLHAFGCDAVRALVQHEVQASHMSTTIHGVGFGLDAGESAQSLTLGFLEGLRTIGTTQLRKITFVDREERHIRLIEAALRQIGITTVPADSTAGGRNHYPIYVDGSPLPLHPERTHLTELTQLRRKEHVFVAMPYSQEFQDVYEFGIYEPIRECGLICEKVDESSFTGDILARIQERIRTASLVVADLTDARPNVYLEVGYAWGQGIPVVFLAREGETLHFDVRTHRCIFYRRIGQLKQDLGKLIRALRLSSTGNADTLPQQHDPVIQVRIIGKVAVVELGQISLVEDWSEVHKRLGRLLDTGFKEFILNLQSVGFLHSVALQAILRMVKDIKAKDGAIKFAVHDGLRDIFTITKLSKVIEAYPDEEQAIRSFQ